MGDNSLCELDLITAQIIQALTAATDPSILKMITVIHIPAGKCAVMEC
jgi:hypothetical protein